MLAIIGGDPNRFRPYVDLYHRAFAQFGRQVREIGVHSHGYVAETDEKARKRPRPRSALSRSDCRGCTLNMGIDRLDCTPTEAHGGWRVRVELRPPFLIPLVETGSESLRN